jgi:signal transduction histidine kinase
MAREAYRLQRTVEAARLLYSTLDLKELTTIILEVIRHELPVDRVTAFVIDEKQKVVRALVAQDVENVSISMPIGRGIAGIVAQTGQAIDAPNAYADARFSPEYDHLLNYRTDNILALPIKKSDGQIVGVLQLLNRKHPIRAEDWEFLQDLTVFIALALENAQLHAELQDKARLEKEVMRSRERLSQMDRLVLIGEVLSTVLNEMRTPAAIVSHQTGLLKHDPDTTPAMLQNVDFIEAATKHSLDSVTTFLDFIRKQKGDRGKVNVQELVGQTLAARRSHWDLERIEVEQHIDQSTPTIVGNSGEIQQAFMHLLKNAEDALACRTETRRLIIRLSHKNQRKVRIQVEDNGPGIPTQLYERVFEPFFSTKSEMARTGLGLTIANRITQEHGGEIFFDTTVGQGTIFTLELPI